MSREEFYAALMALIRAQRPDRELPDLSDDTHLWATGTIDSLTMLEIIVFIEEITGREIVLDLDFLPSFSTMKSIYNAYVSEERTP